MSAMRDVQEQQPPKLVADALVATWAKIFYLDPRYLIEVVVLAQTYKPDEYEKWIREHEKTLPEGTMLITGLANYPYYGAHGDGPLLNFFSAPLDSRWELVREYGLLSYLYRPEPVRLWRLKRATSPPFDDASPSDDVPDIEEVGDYDTLFKRGLELLSKDDHPRARAYFRRIVRDYPDRAEDARFYTAVSFFREPDCKRSIKGFKELLRHDPRSHWVPAAHLHMATCERKLGNVARAQARLCYLITHFTQDPTTVEGARMDIRTITFRNEGILTRLWKRIVRLVIGRAGPSSSVGCRG
jgi:tetratricopeptide (TPR) repeat protein